MKNIFEILLLLARPAAGKSEIIDFLKNIPLEARKTDFHIGEISEIDDFPMLWTWFEEDTLLEQMGYPRMHTDSEGYFLYQYQWDLLIKRIGLEYKKQQRDHRNDYTTIIEFSRGKEHGGYRSAFKHIDLEITQKMAILYINVSYEESLRKNRKRFNAERPDSILEHSLPDKKLERLYKETDWHEISAGNPNYLLIKGVHVPYVVFENEDDVTTSKGKELSDRLKQALKRLWMLNQQRLHTAGNDK